MKHPEKLRNELKASLEKEHGRTFADWELDKAENALEFFSSMIIDVTMEEGAKGR